MRPTVKSRLGFENKQTEILANGRNAKRCDRWESQNSSPRPVAGEGSLPVRHSLLNAALLSQNLATSDPRDPLFTERITFLRRRRKYSFWLEQVLVARQKPTSPHHGY